MARGRHAPRIVRGSARQMIWLTSVFTRTAFAGADAVLIATLNAAALALRPFTIVRTRFDLHVNSDQIAASENVNIAWGIATVTDQAAAIGITAVPTPDTDQGSSKWFALTSRTLRFAFASAVGFEGGTPGGNWMLDSKAMRKVGPQEDVVIVGESPAISAGCNLTTYGRLLIKLH